MSKHVGIVKLGNLEIAVQTNVDAGSYCARASCGSRAHEYKGPTNGAGVSEIAVAVAKNFATRIKTPTVTPTKARRILHDTAKGKPFERTGRPITEQQRKYFGAVASGRAANSPSACRRCNGKRQVPLGKHIVACPLCCRKNPTYYKANGQGSLS